MSRKRRTVDELQATYESLLAQCHRCYESVSEELRWSQEARAALLTRAERADAEIARLRAALIRIETATSNWLESPERIASGAPADLMRRIRSDARGALAETHAP